MSAWSRGDCRVDGGGIDVVVLGTAEPGIGVVLGARDEVLPLLCFAVLKEVGFPLGIFLSSIL